jgi:hypothetical protein
MLAALFVKLAQIVMDFAVAIDICRFRHPATLSTASRTGSKDP